MTKIASFRVLALASAIGCQTAQAQTPIPLSPRDFATAAAQSDHYEILAGHIAVVQAEDTRVRAFAETMIRDHARLTEGLLESAVAAGLPKPDSGVSSDEAALLSGLQGLRGTEFDKAYVRQQVLAHTQALAVEDSFATAGGEENMKKAAQSALPIIQDHLKMARQLSGELGGGR